MTQKTNLRFLLALGNHKLVVVENQQEVSVYTNAHPTHEKNRVDAERIGQAVLAR